MRLGDTVVIGDWVDTSSWSRSFHTDVSIPRVKGKIIEIKHMHYRVEWDLPRHHEWKTANIDKNCLALYSQSCPMEIP